MDKKAQKPTQKKTPRKWSLSEQERVNLSSRNSLVEQYEYQRKLVVQDMDSYVTQVIMPRLSLPATLKIRVSPDFKWVEEIMEENADKKS